MTRSHIMKSFMYDYYRRYIQVGGLCETYHVICADALNVKDSSWPMQLKWCYSTWSDMLKKLGAINGTV